MISHQLLLGDRLHVSKLKAETLRLLSKSDDCFTFSLLQTTITKRRTCNKPKDSKNSIGLYRFLMLGVTLARHVTLATLPLWFNKLLDDIAPGALTE